MAPNGHDFTVSAGRTLLLPCKGSSRPKQKWIRQKEGGRREVIFTRFKDGTVKSETDGGRLSFAHDALQIQDLQLEDSGEYLCNGILQARVGVLTVQPEPTSIPSSTSTTSTVMKTDVVETKKKEKKRPENALLLVAIVGLGLMILFMAAVCVLLTSMKCRRRKKCKYAAALRHEDTELQPWKTSSGQTECEATESPSPPEETIHYASLGRQNWRERPSRTPPDQSPHSVIYSSVITRPAAR
ncbi:uncharacterized protein LOC103374123 [Stegastes partitus]|uniref:Uncharacterized protein LOC103374123 n=1 Tax=Stegastes partitus TaxID=144197 RepID=A0A9Y4NRV9_9TELE|nr:PREDICTED: uncharacterized protein LOC103374123 [Stegastes partitus]